MYFRNFSVALVSTLVASGAYFAYRNTPGRTSAGDVLSSNSPTSRVGQGREFSTTVIPGAGAGFHTAAASLEDAKEQATRRALVIDAGQLYSATITGDGPLSKSTDDHGRKVLEMMTPEQATQRLRRNEESFHVNRGQGVVRYDVVQLASNDPIEDDHAEQIIEVPSPTASNDWMFWGVFDGHSGWTTSAKLRQALISYVARELNTTYSSVAKSTTPALPTPSSIDEAIKRGFLALDTSIVHHSVAEVMKSKSKPQAARLLAPALSGSCALLSFYDSASRTLRVACTGDSRAVLGRRSASDAAKWVALPLSVDQTGGNAAEAARLRAEHPGEADVVRNGRVLGGLEPTRAFGDASYKWSRETQERIKREYFGRSVGGALRTPPYVTAEPVVTTTQVRPEQGDFVVMATDGLWEMLTNEEVVGLVGQWLEKHPDAQRAGGRAGAGAAATGGGAETEAAAKERADGWLQSWFSSSPKKPADLPVQQADGAADQSGQRAPIRQQQWGLPPTTSATNGTPSSSRFVVEDRNVATHLIRNALGGGDRDMVCALLTLPSPYSRRYRYVLCCSSFLPCRVANGFVCRDDLTVEVIFFGEGGRPSGGGAQVSINEEATAKIKDEAKAKL